MKREERRAILQDCGAKRKARRLQIIASLMLNGHTVVSIADAHGITPQSISKVISGRMHTGRILDMLRVAGAREYDLFDPSKVIIAKIQCQYSTKELATLFDKPVQTILNWANNEKWQGQKRQGKGGGMVWHTLSLPEKRRTALSIAAQVKANA